jgi:hypothetical protein
MNQTKFKDLRRKYEEKLNSFEKKYGIFTDSNYNPIIPLIEIIKGWSFAKGPKGLKPWEESFKDYVCPFRRSKNNMGFVENIRQKLNCGPQLLYYPCKPNADEHAQYADPEKNLLAVPARVSNYSRVENELNAVVSGGGKYLLDINSFPLTDKLNHVLYSHSTLLDFIFANADITEEGQKDSVTACLNAFLELYNEEPKFRGKLDDALLLQAMDNAPEETQIYITEHCPALAEYSTLTNEDLSK